MTMPEIASQVVKCLRIKEGDVVLIHSWHHTVDLAVDIAAECYRVGADPLIALQTDHLLYRMANEVPEDRLREVPESLLALANTITVCITMAGPEDPEVMWRIPPEKLRALRISASEILEVESRRKVREAELLIGKVTPKRAESYGLNFSEYKKMTEEALTVNYEEMREIGRELAEEIEGAREVHISSASGTDLRFRMDGRPVYIEDGIIDEEDVEKGFTSTYLPAGCLTVAPIEDSAEGRAVFDVPKPVFGKTIERMEWFFEKGRLSFWKAMAGSELFKKVLEGMSGDRDRMGLFMIGLNPAIRAGYPLSEIALGAISIGIGDNKAYGGKNKGVGVLTASTSGATVEIDGRSIVTNGKLGCRP